MEKAKGDYTYCVSEECLNKCKRHTDNYEFNSKELYSFCDFDYESCKESDIYMSKADRMFKKLGYEKDISQWGISYKNEDDKIIKFNNDKTISCVNFYDGFESITMQELQAINEKVKELGWANEM